MKANKSKYFYVKASYKDNYREYYVANILHAQIEMASQVYHGQIKPYQVKVEIIK